MNILVVAHFQGDGSPNAIFVHDQVKEFRKMGHRVRVFIPIPAFKKDYYNRRFLFPILQKTIDGIDCIFFRYLSASKYGEKRFNSLSAVGVVKAKWNTLIGDFIPDIIHAHTFSIDIDIAIFCKKKLVIPCVITTHGTDLKQKAKICNKGEMEKIIGKVDRIVTVSDRLKERLLSICPSANPVVVYNGCNLCEDMNYSKEEKSILFVGNLIKQKNADLVIELVDKLWEKQINAKLKIIGDGEERTHLEELCERLNLGNKVEFLGKRTNQFVLNEMSRTEYFIMPSVDEAFGIVYIEAMSAGCIVIGTKGEGIDGIIKNGENGFLVNPNVDELFKIVEYCENNNSIKLQLMSKAKSVARTMSWGENAKKNLEIFSDLIEERNDVRFEN